MVRHPLNKRDRVALERLMYEAGQTKPNYPVPALRHWVDLRDGSIFKAEYDCEEYTCWVRYD